MFMLEVMEMNRDKVIEFLRGFPARHGHEALPKDLLEAIPSLAVDRRLQEREQPGTILHDGLGDHSTKEFLD